MSSEFTFTADNSQEVLDAMCEILLTPIGIQYREEFYRPETGEQHTRQILDAAQTIAGGPRITTQHMEHALRLLIDSGSIQPVDIQIEEELSEPEIDTRPRTRDGKLMTPAQIQWSEFRKFSETASMKDIAERKRIDQAYASFVRKNLEREMAGVADGVTPAGQSKLPRHDASNELVAFARKYMVEKTENLKPRGGFVTLAGEQIPYARFVALVNAATQAHLL
jgi:hypothetical protein